MRVCQKNERGSAIGWWGMGNVMGPALGPTLGGVLTQYFGWESIFYVNIPIGFITLILATKYLTFLKKRPRTLPRFDFRGYLWFVCFVSMLLFTLTTTSARYGFLSWQFISGLILTLIFLRAFIRSGRRPEPLLDLSVFNIAAFNRAYIIVAIRSLALFGGMFFLPFLLQGLLGYSEVQSALLILPNALVMMITRPLAGKLADKGRIRYISMAGIMILASSFVMFAFIDIGTAVWFIIGSMVIRGLGISLLISPVSTALLNSVQPSQTSTATSLTSLMQQLGGSIGIAISSSLHTYIYDFYIIKGETEKVAEHFALQDGFLFTAALILITLIPARKLPQIASKKVKGKEIIG
ncbi:MAG: MFS transporter [Chitinophagaceae bacterium]|nr:MFS transporter [Chitinophagaceae bacterium]